MKKRRPGDVESPSRNIRHFTNRENERELFARLLHQPTGGHLPVLSFYGVGGTGKSWLVHKLRDIVTTAEEVPQAHLDFSILKGGEIYQRDHAAALAEIQRQLDVPCPRFEVAYNVMLWKQGRRDKVESRVDDTASTGWQIAIALGQDAASALVPGVNVAGKLLEKFGETAGRRLRATALGRWLETRGSSDFLRGLTARTAQEIGAELVDHLARDLHEELPARPGRACRAVLFFDTFEDLVRDTGRGPGRDRSARQQWVQDLYRALLDDAEEPRGTVLFVVAGRDKLVWDDDFDDPRYLDQHRVGGLSATDARRFLDGCGIYEAPLQSAILRVATDTEAAGESGYHPFTLGLCADTVVSERARGREPEAASFSMSAGDVRELVERFLASFDGTQEAYAPWMFRLALTPRWDETAARQAYSPVEDAQQDAAWDALLSYSFVQPPAGDEPWWGLHVRMRDALRARHAERPDRVARDHQFWHEHWLARSERPTDTCAGHAWYHAYCLDPAAARAHWTALAEECRQALRTAEHHALLGWWVPTGLPGKAAAGDENEGAALWALGLELTQAVLGDRRAHATLAIACYTAALPAYGEAEVPFARAQLLVGLGNAHLALPGADRRGSAREAVACYQAALRVLTEESHPEAWAAAMNSLGLAHLELPAERPLEHVHAAIACFDAALRVYTEAALPESWAMTLVNLGRARLSLPPGAAGANVLEAIRCFEAALRVRTEDALPQAWAATLLMMGDACRVLPAGDKAQHVRRAIECLSAALRVYTEAAFPRAWAATMVNLGNAWYELPEGDVEARRAAAVRCYGDALRVFREDTLPAEWATTMNSLGTVYREMTGGDRAEHLRRAVECYEGALRVVTEFAAPRHWASVTENLAVTLVHLSNSLLGEGGLMTRDQALARAACLARARDSFLAAERGFRQVGLDDVADVSARNARTCEAQIGPVGC
jgi:tetratricopeptide (TPR) repeat protein